MKARETVRAFGGEVYDDGSFILPLNEATTMPVLNALLRSSR